MGAFSDFLMKFPYDEEPLYSPEMDGGSFELEEGRLEGFGKDPSPSLCQFVFVASLAIVRASVMEV